MPRTKRPAAAPVEESFPLGEERVAVSERKQEEKRAPEQVADNSSGLLSTLDETTRKVFENMPIDKAVSPDSLSALGIGIGDAITSLTMLELCGLVSSLPGGLYIRK